MFTETKMLQLWIFVTPIHKHEKLICHNIQNNFTSNVCVTHVYISCLNSFLNERQFQKRLKLNSLPKQYVQYSNKMHYQFLAQNFIASLRCRLILRRLMSYIYGAPILDVSRSHTTTQHSREDSPGRVISSSQRPLPDNTRHSQQTNIHAPGGIRTQDLSRQAAWGRSPAEILGSNPTGGMDICLLWVSCVVR